MRLKFVALGLVSAIVATASAQFQPGSIALVQMGDGTTTLASTGNAVNVVQLLRAGLSQSATTIITFPNQANTATPSNGLISSGTATSEGALTRSQNGLYLTLMGYRMRSASGSVANSSPSASGVWGSPIPRVAGLVPFTGNLVNFSSYDLSTNQPDSNSFPTNNPRSAVTVDGTQFWCGGANTGVLNASLGATSPTIVSNTSVNNRFITYANGNLFFSSASPSGSQGIWRISGTPATSGNTALRVSATPTTTSTSGSPYSFYFIDAQNAVVADDTATTGGVFLLTLTTPGTTWDNVSATETIGTGVSSTQLISNSATVSCRSLFTDGVNVYVSTGDTSGTASVVAFPLTSSGLSFGSASVLYTTSANFVARGIAMAPEPSVVSASYNSTAATLSVAMRSTSTTSGNLAGYGRAIKIGNVSFTTYRSISAVGSNIDYVGHIQTMKTDSAGNQYLLQTQANSTFTGYQFQIIARSSTGSALTGSAQISAPAGYTPAAMAIDPNGNGNIAVLLTNGVQAQIQLLTNNGSGTLTTGTLLNNSGTQYTLGTQTPIDISYNNSDGVNVLWSDNLSGATSNSISDTTYSGQTQTQVGSSQSVSSMRPMNFVIDENGNFRVLSSQLGSVTNSTGAFRIDTINSGFTSLSQGATQNRDNQQTNTVTSATISRQLIPLGLTVDRSTADPIVFFSGANGNPTATAPSSQAGILGSFVAWQFGASASSGPQLSTFRFFPGINF